MKVIKKSTRIVIGIASFHLVFFLIGGIVTMVDNSYSISNFLRGGGIVVTFALISILIVAFLIGFIAFMVWCFDPNTRYL